MRNQIDAFVKENFWILYKGAVRIGGGTAIESDYYAPERIQINKTRLHLHQGLKYASSHKYNEHSAPTEEQLRNAISDIQLLIDEAAKDIPPPFSLEIKKIN